MARREELNAILVNALAAGGMNPQLAENRVFYQPPNGITLDFPCIVYKLSGDKAIHADNLLYGVLSNRYEVTLIDRNPDSVYYNEIRKIKMTNFLRAFDNDNLHHWVFAINY